MKMPSYIFPITFCDKCRTIGMKSNFRRHDNKYMFRSHYLCKHCNGDTIAARYLAEKAHRKAIDLQRDAWNTAMRNLGKKKAINTHR